MGTNGARHGVRRAHDDAGRVPEPARVSGPRAQRDRAADAQRRVHGGRDGTSIPRWASSAARAGSASSSCRPSHGIRRASWTRFQEIRPHSSYRAYWDLDGFQETGYWHLDSHWELKNGYEFHTGMNVTREGVVGGFEIFPGIGSRPAPTTTLEAQFVLQTNQAAPVSSRIEFRRGRLFRRQPGRAGLPLRIRTGETFKAELSWTRNDIDLPWRRLRHQPRPHAGFLFVLAPPLRPGPPSGTTTAPTSGPPTSASAGSSRPTPASSSSTPTPIRLDGVDLARQRPDRSFTVKISRMFDLLD